MRNSGKVNATHPRDTRTLGKAAAFLAVALCSVCVVPPSAFATLKGDKELIRLVAEARKDNVERISTWQGKAKIEGLEEDSQGSVDDRSMSSVVFFYDREKNATRWNWTVEDYWVQEKPGGPLVLAPKKREIDNSMRKGNAFYRFMPGIIRGEEVENTLVIWPKEEQRLHPFTYDFDPMWYFTQRGYNFQDRLLHAYRESNNPALCPATVERKQDLVIWELRWKELQGSYEAVNHFEMDLSKGGNLVRYYATSTPETSELCEWAYEEKEGIWVPCRFTWECVGKDAKGDRRKNIRRVQFTENIVNQPLDAAEFSVEKLGVKMGTRVTDRIAGVAYKYGLTPPMPDKGEAGPDLDLEEVKLSQKGPSEKPTPAPTDTRSTVTRTVAPTPRKTPLPPNKEQPSTPASSSHTTRFLWIILPVLAVVVLFFGISRRRRSN